jgi:hypothetical protein
MYRVFICPQCLCVAHSVQYCVECFVPSVDTRYMLPLLLCPNAIINCVPSVLFVPECFENTRYNIKYVECFACAKCKGNLSRENVYRVSYPECHTWYSMYRVIFSLYFMTLGTLTHSGSACCYPNYLEPALL